MVNKMKCYPVDDVINMINRLKDIIFREENLNTNFVAIAVKQNSGK